MCHTAGGLKAVGGEIHQAILLCSMIFMDFLHLEIEIGFSGNSRFENTSTSAAGTKLVSKPLCRKAARRFCI